MRASRPLHSRTPPRAVLTRGFTLIELMVTLAVVAIVLAMAVPSFESVINSNTLTGAANEMVSSLQEARMEAFRRNQRAGICSSANAGAGVDATCADANINGWITFVDANSDDDFDKVGDTLLRNSVMDESVELTASPAVGNAVIFRTDGFARTVSSDVDLLDGVISFCIATRRPATNQRHLDIGSGSRISVSEFDGGGACATPANP